MILCPSAASETPHNEEVKQKSNLLHIVHILISYSGTLANTKPCEHNDVNVA